MGKMKQSLEEDDRPQTASKTCYHTQLPDTILGFNPHQNQQRLGELTALPQIP